jgi:hypothetical protein
VKLPKSSFKGAKRAEETVVEVVPKNDPLTRANALSPTDDDDAAQIMAELAVIATEIEDAIEAKEWQEANDKLDTMIERSEYMKDFLLSKQETPNA